MNKKEYDLFMIGHISLDEIIYKGVTEKIVGGAVVYSSYAAFASGNSVGVLTKMAPENMDFMDHFSIDKQDIYYVQSVKTTSIRNEFLSDDRERRKLKALAIADSFKSGDIPDVKAKVYYLGGLITGEFEESLLKYLCNGKVVAADMQGFLRHALEDTMVFKDWGRKYKYLDKIHYLKVDAAEAEVMTGLSDRREAAKALHDMGSKEVVLTYNTEVLVYDGKNYYSAPFKPRNLTGRTGRGDTCFSTYIGERLKGRGIDESALYAAAITSLKMETPGPFKGTRNDVLQYIKEFY